MALQAGDLLFIKNQHEPMDEAIAASTGTYVHVGIAVDDQTVIHASPRYGVAMQDLAQFQAEFGQPDVIAHKLMMSRRSLRVRKRILGNRIMPPSIQMVRDCIVLNWLKLPLVIDCRLNRSRYVFMMRPMIFRPIGKLIMTN